MPSAAATPAASGPKTPAQLLRRLLHHHRTCRDWSQENVGSRLGVTGQYVSDWERGRSIPKLRYCRDLDRVFGLETAPCNFSDLRDLIDSHVDEEEKDILVEFLDVERNACELSVYAPFVPPGLIQTPEVAEAIYAAVCQGQELRRQVEARILRQSIFTRDDPPLVEILMPSTVIERVIHSEVVWKGQLARVLELADLPRVTISVVPAKTPVYLDFAYTLMRFRESAHAEYSEAAKTPSVMSRSSAYVEDLRIRFAADRSFALSRLDSIRFIRDVMERL